MNLAVTLLAFVPQHKPQLGRRLPHALQSLERTEFPGKVFVIDDCSNCSQHRAFLRGLPNWVTVVRRADRGGIARAKNTCLRVLQQTDFEFGFLVEDDMEFLPGWWQAYSRARKLSGVHHFSWASDDYWGKGRMVKRLRQTGKIKIVEASTLNGSFLTFTPAMLKKLGGFVVGPHFWGREHINYTRRAVNAGFAPFFADIQNSNERVNLGPFSKHTFINHKGRLRGNRMNMRTASNLATRQPIKE